ncbi:MAG TPA: cupredoxin domain-containing protein [Patescibacteria group bacterium]|nr:cupredoxin domain-containing protein [Patescibacteria group bacterium]
MEENTNQVANGKRGGISPLVIFFFVLIVIAGGAYYFLSQANSKESQNTLLPTNQTKSQNTEVTPAASGPVKEFTIDGSSYALNPATITVNKGDSVKITFKDNDSSHDLVIDGYNLRTKVLRPGGTDTIEFVADKAGTFEYFCSVANHRALGMTGTLVVQ